MPKELIVSITHQETKAAIVENDQVTEVHIERDKDHGIVGAICKGRVTKVLPGMQSAFVDIGLERDAFLYVSDFFEDTEEYDKLVTTAEEQVAKLGTPGAASPSPQPQVLVTPTPETGVAPFNSGRFQDRHGRSRRSRRFRLKGKHFEPAPAAGPQPAESASSTSESPIAQAQPAGSELLSPLSLLPGESVAKYQGAQTASLVVESNVDSSSQEETVKSLSEVGVTSSLDLGVLGETFPPLEPEEREAVAEAVAASPPYTPSEVSEAIVPVSALALDPSVQQTADTETAQAATTDATASEPSKTIAHLEVPAPMSRPETQENISEAECAQEAAPAEAIPRAAESVAENLPERSGILEAVTPSPSTTTEGGVAATAMSGPTSGPTDSPSKAHFRKAPGTSKFFRRSMDRRKQQASTEERQESSFSGPSQPLIADLLKEGQEILVQIAKEPLGTKGARITSHIALPGRYLVYMPTVEHVGVSRKIESDEERQRLKRIIQENRRSKFPGGFIVRTAGQGKGEEEFKSDINFLYALWAEIRTRADSKRAGSVVHRDLNLVQRILRDQLSADFTNIRVDNESEYAAIVEFINRFQPSLVSRVKLYTKDTPIFEEFGIQSEIDKALRNKVWLKSGGYIVIDQAEALVAIDVNTGKYVGKSNKLEDTIVKTNIEAAKEIARQIRLRDLGGIIVCDFIDMEDRKNRFKVTQTLEEALRSDKSPSKILQFNDFGLVAITRKRVKQSLMRALCEPCLQCTGSGMVKSAQTVCYEIQGEVKKMSKALDGREITIRVSPEVGKALKTTEASVITDMEALLKRDIIIKTDPLLHPERFDIF